MCDDHRMTSPQVPAAQVLSALLDRSIEQMAEAAQDVRRFDREAIRAAADVWDNNLYPLFLAVSTSRARERERRALAALRWMASFSARRRTWMSEQAAPAGYELDAVLPPTRPWVPGRDSLGHVMAPMGGITRRDLDPLLPDYDLAEASVRHIQVERVGTRLSAYLELVVPRVYAVERNTSPEPALLDMWLDDVTESVFDLSDTQGAALDPGPDGIELALGTAGRLRAAAGEFSLDDRSWHLSAAGRRADAVSPPRTEGSGRRSAPPVKGRLGTDGYAAAALMHRAMLELRSVRYATRADHVPVLDLCRAYSGAGRAVLAAGSRLGGRRREAAFRDLIRTWTDRGGPALVDAPRPTARTPRRLTGEPSQAVLVMASWTAAHTKYGTDRPAGARLQLALPPGTEEVPAAAWRLRTVECTGPEAFRLRTAAFRGPGPLVRSGQPAGTACLDLHEGAMHVVTRDGGSAPVR
ncbi:hypothetical protein SAMN05216252_107449 [Actinacidiphila glaucinigra]|uniref:Uncharacterized protein n=2 Tax=Actinacidiphila glaucinigra TaxID=235986 RepID=A0A239GL58_9ACTN|nr:hypothetical protein SAMN05216252_107449 [Actinacidiphila glaucinigra]